MLLSPGLRVGPYQIVALLGTGGMGEVYRALDSRLGREVAIKVLRSGVGDAWRFEMEARAASSLNHPNILTIHDVGESDGAPYIVSELLSGDSLRTLLREGSLPTRRLLDIAIQIAAGLAAAHAGGITHRDLKPENVMVQPDGQVKILDFGLAKPATSDSGSDDDETRTAHGILVGTLAYMSPEQALGKDVDYRSDQFSFGAMLYEMATGKTPFRREDRIGTLSAIVREEPPSVGSLSPGTPPPLRWIIERCLAKEPERRYTATADLCQQLRDVRDHLSEVYSSSTAVPLAKARASSRWALRSALALALVGCGFLAGLAILSRTAGVRAFRFTPFATEGVDEGEPAWSPDGQTIAYIARVHGITQVLARKIDSPEPAAVTTAPTDCRFPFWSPDGSRIYYWSGWDLWSVGAAGGEPQRIVHDVVWAAPPASVSRDGKLLAYFAADGAFNTVRLMTLADGKSEVYSRPPFPAKFRTASGMRFSPDGRTILVWLVPDVDHGTDLWLLPVAGGEPRRVPSDLLRGYKSLSANWMADNRHIALATEPTPGAGFHIYKLDTETGNAEPLTQGTGEERDPSVSPDGKRMAFSSGGANSDLMEVSTDGADVSTLLATSRREHSASWSPSGRYLTYVSDANGLPEIWLRSPAEGWARPVVRHSAEGHLDFSSPRFSPDGLRLAYARVGEKHLISIVNLSGGQTVPLERESVDQHSPEWSPDGHWIAYTRYVGRKWEVAKSASGGGGHPVHLADGGGPLSRLEWSPTGQWICFSTGDQIYAIPAEGGTPRLLLKGAAAFTFKRDGSNILAVRRAKDWSWELLTVRVQDGLESRPLALNLPSEALLAGARLHPDGKRMVLTVTQWKRDIWILDDWNLSAWRNLFGPRPSLGEGDSGPLH